MQSQLLLELLLLILQQFYMPTENYSQCSTIIPNTHCHFLEPIAIHPLVLPIMVSFSSRFTFKIQQSQQNTSCVIAEVVSENGLPLQIRPFYKTIFTQELQSICNAKLTQIQDTYKIHQLNSLNSTSFAIFTPEKLADCSTQAFINEKSRIIIQISESSSMMEQNQQSGKDLTQFFLFFLSQISHSLSILLQRMGIIKASFRQKMKNHREIVLSKKSLKKIIRNNYQVEAETPNSKTQELSIKTPTGVFEHLNVVREQRLSQNELIFKRGGYFDIVKRKLIVYNQINQIPILQCKSLAEKKLSRRKRPNTIFNYQGKIPKELKLLQCLSSLPLYELNFFAKYYFLNPATRTDFRSNQMVDESQANEKDTVSTMSEENQATMLSDVIYMDFYEENLEEYLIRKGQLDIFQIVHLIRQIFQSVQSLHKVGIVHRDIKPANFMIERLQDGQIKTKLIDFGESSHVASNYDSKQILGFTTPYAPIECTYLCKEGYNCKQIDLWSLGVLIYKLTTNRMPVTYSKCFKSDIKYEWPTSLAFFIPEYSQGRWSILENMLVTLSLMFMKVKPKERLSLEKGMRILDGIQNLARHFTYQL